MILGKEMISLVAQQSISQHWKWPSIISTSNCTCNFFLNHSIYYNRSTPLTLNLYSDKDIGLQGTVDLLVTLFPKQIDGDIDDVN
jgi:hypothetical protein